MGRDHKKTNSAQSSRSSDEPEVEERKSALGDQEVGDDEEGYESEAAAAASGEGEPIDGTQEAATAAAGEESPSWGFEEKKKRFSKEVLIAFVAICVLVGLFGIIVWKQFKKPGKTPDAAEIAANSEKEEPKEKDPFAEDQKQAQVTVETSKEIVVQNEPPTANIGSSEPPQQELPSDPFGSPKSQPETTTDLFADANAARPMGLLDRRPQPQAEPLMADNDPLLGTSEPAPMNAIDSQPMARMKTEVAVMTEEPSLDVGTPKEPTDDLFSEPLPNRKQIKPSIDTNRFSVNEELEVGRPQPQPEPRVEQFDEPPMRQPLVATRVEEPRTLDPMPTDEIYIVKEGDTFWDISKKIYGTHGLFLALYEHNRDLSPKADLLKPGMKLRTPSCEVLKVIAAKVTEGVPERPEGRIVVAAGGSNPITTVARREALKPGVYETEKGLKVYRVGEGDTLRRIAQLHLGRAERWMQIYEMNRSALKNEHDLQIGTQLRLPADASIEPLVTPIASGR